MDAFVVCEFNLCKVENNLISNCLEFDKPIMKIMWNMKWTKVAKIILKNNKMGEIAQQIIKSYCKGRLVRTM